MLSTAAALTQHAPALPSDPPRTPLGPPSDPFCSKSHRPSDPILPSISDPIPSYSIPLLQPPSDPFRPTSDRAFDPVLHLIQTTSCVSAYLAAELLRQPLDAAAPLDDHLQQKVHHRRLRRRTYVTPASVARCLRHTRS
eukprot:1128943-Prorocentrum_minimum.AAC.1